MNWFNLLILHCTLHTFDLSSILMQKLEDLSMAVLCSKEGRCNAQILWVLLSGIKIDCLVPDVVHFVCKDVLIINEGFNYT
jgi:hypothetical protein